jgi:hypothetical protein
MIRRKVSERDQIIGVTAADQSADRRADDNVGNDSLSCQCLNDADMSEATRRAATQDQPYQGSAQLALKWFGANVCNSHFALLTFCAGETPDP